MNALIELFAVTLQVLMSWLYSSILNFGIKLLVVILSGIFGWIVGWFLGDTFLAIFAQLGITGVSMWQIGAFLGFVGSFFTPLVTQNNKNNEKSKSAETPTQKQTWFR